MRLITLMILMSLANAAFAAVVRFETTVGNIDIELYEDDAPITVQNFLNYVNRGDYDGTAIHRTDPGFIIQGGGYRFQGNSTFSTVPTDAPIVIEANRSNLEGTIAMARNNNPNSATNQWFINLTDNVGLDPGGFTADGYAVFGKVIRGMEHVHVIESLLRVNFFDATPAGVFGEFPLYRYDEGGNPSGSNPIEEDNIVEITRAFVLSESFVINEGISGAWVNPLTSGQGAYFEVLPAVNVLIMAWFTFDEADEQPTNKTIGDASNRWLTASGNYVGNTFVGSLFKTSGGVFDDPQTVSTTEVGSVSIQFSDCSTALMSYIIQDGDVNLSNTMQLQRVSGINVDFCEQLAIEQNPGVGAQ